MYFSLTLEYFVFKNTNRMEFPKDLLDLLDISSLETKVSCILIFVSVLVLTHYFFKKPAGIPPGWAFTFPLVGDLPLLIGGDILSTFGKLRRHHGDIFSFYLGRDLTIVINGFQLIQKAAVKQGHLFSGRPKNLIGNIMGDGRGIILSEGPFWKRQRKFIHSCLQELGFGKRTLESNIMREVVCFVDVLKQQNGEPFDFKESIQTSVANVVFAMVCGKRHDYNDERFRRFLHVSDVASQKLLEDSVIVSCVPFMRYVPGDPLQVNKITNFLDEWDQFITKMYEEHKNTHDPNSPRDLIDFYITEILKNQSPKETSDFTLNQLIAVAVDLFGAGAETTATALRWAVLYLFKYPDIQERLHSEIGKVFSNNSLPTLDDRQKLPYVEAFIHEVLRYANIVPLSLPHCVNTDKDIIFEGYTIPRNTSVVFNLDSVLQDPDIFENPTVFNPERFLDSDGNLIRPKQFIPFGIGRRVCLGEAVAKMELFLFVTTLIKNFHFESGESSELDMKGILGITNSPSPYKVKAVKRQ